MSSALLSLGGGSLALLVWRPAVGPWILTALLLAVALVARRVWRVLRVRLGTPRAAVLLGLRCAVLAGLVAVLLDPGCERRVRRRDRRELVLVVDRSASMAVADRGSGEGTRLERAVALAERIARQAPGDLRVRRFAADTELATVEAWEPISPRSDRSVRSDRSTGPAADSLPGTDLSAVLLRLAEDPGARNAAAVVLLTDGGDGVIEPALLPDAPLLVIGLGGDPERWRDLSVETVRHPDRAGTGERVTVEADVRRRTADDAGFAERSRSLRVVLEREQSGEFAVLGEQLVEFPEERDAVATARFELPVEEAGEALWRVRAEGVEGEVSQLNNAREFPLTITEESLRVLYFSRRLGADLKFLRQELSADAAVSFSTLVQTAGNRFLLQGDAKAWDELASPTGLPELATLKRFEAVVLGSFPASEWTLQEMEALRTYVEEGGGLLWVGGEDSFDAGYAASPLAELIPWRAGDGGAFLRSAATVSPTAEGAARWGGVFGGAAEGEGLPEVQALYRAGALKAGAVAWLEARSAQGTMPFLVEQPYGRGRVFTLTSNTTWRWALAGPPLDRLYRQLWRQTVRAVGGLGEAEGNLRLRLDRDRIQPGMRVTLEVDVLDATPQSGASVVLEGPEGVEVVGLERDGAVSGRWRGSFVCRSRGGHLLKVQALRDGMPVETLERSLAVAPGEREGSRLELDLAELERLALRGGGLARSEEDEGWESWLAARLAPEVRVETQSVVSSGPWVLLVLLALMMLEWLLRRRSNLV